MLKLPGYVGGLVSGVHHIFMLRGVEDSICNLKNSTIFPKGKVILESEKGISYFIINLEHRTNRRLTFDIYFPCLHQSMVNMFFK
jgi:hypothetical protein